MDQRSHMCHGQNMIYYQHIMDIYGLCSSIHPSQNFMGILIIMDTSNPCENGLKIPIPMGVTCHHPLFPLVAELLTVDAQAHELLLGRLLEPEASSARSKNGQT